MCDFQKQMSWNKKYDYEKETGSIDISYFDVKPYAVVASFANANTAKKLKNDWNPGTWYSSESTQWELSNPMNTNMTGFRSLHSFALHERSLSIGRANLKENKANFCNMKTWQTWK